MQTTILTLALAFTGWLLAAEAWAKEHSSDSRHSKSASHATGNNTSRSSGLTHSTKPATSKNIHSTGSSKTAAKSVGQNIVKPNGSTGSTKAAALSNSSKLKNAGTKITAAKNSSNSLKSKKQIASKQFKNPSKNFKKNGGKMNEFAKWNKPKWWSCHNFYCGFGWWGCGGCWGDCYCGGSWNECCCQPYYCNPCYNVCAQYSSPVIPTFDPEEAAAPDVAPAPRIARIVNPADSQTALGFAVNGQAYTLAAGQSQDVELGDGAVVEFDPGTDKVVRYSLNEGVYTFRSTPQGWGLFDASDAPLAAAVASN